VWPSTLDEAETTPRRGSPAPNPYWDPPSSTASRRTTPYRPYLSPRSPKPGLPAAKPPGCKETGHELAPTASIRSEPGHGQESSPHETSQLDPGPAAERLAYSVDEAARLTGLSRDLLYDEMRRGNLSYTKVGRRRIIARQHLQQFLGIAS
jgi:excisionase family DNA binding protein